MIVLSKEQVIALHAMLIEVFGGLNGIRDEGLLDSALNSAFQTFDSEDLFKTVPEKTARLAIGLIKNHPFIDGNKRIAAHITLLLLELNGIAIYYSQNELIDVILKSAAGEYGYEELLKWILEHAADKK